MPNPAKLRRIEIDPIDDVTFIFDDSEEHFSAGEFQLGSLVRRHLETIEYEILDYNSEVELLRNEC